MNTSLNFKVNNPDRYIEKLMRMKGVTAAHLYFEAQGEERAQIKSFEEYTGEKDYYSNFKNAAYILELKYKDKPLIFTFRGKNLNIVGEDSLFIRELEKLLRESTDEKFISCYSWLKGPDKNFSQMYTYEIDPFAFCESILTNKNLHISAHTQTMDKIIDLPDPVNIKKLKELYDNKEIVLFRVSGKYMNCKIEIIVYFSVNKIRISCSKKTYLDDLAEEISVKEAV